MNLRIFRAHSDPKREGLSWSERWEGRDKGLITCWEIGRELAHKEPKLAGRAINGELPVLGWKGGVEKRIKKMDKYGSLFYLAQWHGLRGEDLDIDLCKETELTCSRTGMRVTYTSDANKYVNA